MDNKNFLPFFITAFLLTGCPRINVAQANPSILIAQSIWKPFSSQEGRFKVLLPGTPTQEKKNTKTKYGTFPTTIFSVVREEEAGYLVSYLDFPQNINLTARNRDQYLSAIATGFAQGAGGRLVSQQNIRLGNLSGKEVRLQFEQGVIGKGRLFLANKRLYTVIVITDKEKNLTKSIQGYLNSFQLLNNSANPGKPTPRKPTIEELNTDLQKAVCSQNWPQSLKIIDQMVAIAPTPDVRDQLVTYRGQLQGLANSGSTIPPQSLPGCATGR